MTPPVVFFDLVGTLIRPAATVGAQYADLAAHHGVNADRTALDAAFRSAVLAAPSPWMRGGPPSEVAELERKYWRELVTDVLARAGLASAFAPAVFDRYFGELFAHFATGAAWRTYPDTVPALKGLHEAGLRLGLITNFDSRVFALLEALRLERLLDPIVIPATAGAPKPDPRIFRNALNRAGVDPADAVHVGDRIEDDIDGAQAVRIRAVLVDRQDRHRGFLRAERIRSLGELAALVG